MLALASFVIGMAGVIFYINLKRFSKKSASHTDNSVIEAIVSEYTRKLEEFGRIIGELKVKIDTIELRLLQYATSHERPLGSSLDLISRDESRLEDQPTNITYSKVATTQKSKPTVHENTSDYILKLLVEKPRTSREIYNAIGRTREHTSRLMRKLYESNLVNRDNNNKPFKYIITDEGRRRLIFQNKKTEMSSSDMSILSGSQDID